MDRKRLILAAGLVGLMGVVFVGLNGLNEPAPAPVAPKPEVIVEKISYTKVLGVVEPLQKGTRVSADDFTEIDWPTDALTPALITLDSDSEIPVVDQLEGSIVRDALSPGEPLTYSKFIRAGEAGIMAALLKPGMRATTTRISVDTASGGFIQPGDRVDVLLKEAVPSQNGGKPDITVKTIYENVLVLAIDQSYTNNPDGGAALPGSTATLELSVEDSEAIMVSQDKGDLILLLRGFSGANSRGQTRATEPRSDVIFTPPLMVFRKGDVETVELKQR